MRVTSLGDIIAEGEYLLDGMTTVLPTIGKPTKMPDHPDYCCPYEIIGLDRSGIRYACGVDAVQALNLAMQTIGVTLHASEETRSGRLAWLEAGNRDLGLPLPEGFDDHNSGV